MSTKFHNVETETVWLPGHHTFCNRTPSGFDHYREMFPELPRFESGIEATIQAAKAVIENYPGVRIDMVGDNPTYMIEFTKLKFWYSGKIRAVVMSHFERDVLNNTQGGYCFTVEQGNTNTMAGKLLLKNGTIRDLTGYRVIKSTTACAPIMELVTP
jgi:hypothetical protein